QRLLGFVDGTNLGNERKAPPGRRQIATGTGRNEELCAARRFGWQSRYSGRQREAVAGWLAPEALEQIRPGERVRADRNSRRGFLPAQRAGQTQIRPFERRYREKAEGIRLFFEEGLQVGRAG
ncbi:MAG: hypothetical protein JNL61_18545, partial [Rhizobiaceae bacterium]|nr:hypothetical protein [Rhizobiaceae bacterium]